MAKEHGIGSIYDGENAVRIALANPAHSTEGDDTVPAKLRMRNVETGEVLSSRRIRVKTS